MILSKQFTINMKKKETHNEERFPQEELAYWFSTKPCGATPDSINQE